MRRLRCHAVGKDSLIKYQINRLIYCLWSTCILPLMALWFNSKQPCQSLPSSPPGQDSHALCDLCGGGSHNKLPLLRSCSINQQANERKYPVRCLCSGLMEREDFKLHRGSCAWPWLLAALLSMHGRLGVHPKCPRHRQQGWATLSQTSLMGFEMNVISN